MTAFWNEVHVPIMPVWVGDGPEDVVAVDVDVDVVGLVVGDPGTPTQ